MLLATFIGCAPGPAKADLPLLEGYWEIQKVTFADGQEKAYGPNPSVDYIQLDGLNGTRQKVYPALDGTFSTNGIAEPFTVLPSESGMQIQYKGRFDTRQETLIKLSREQFSIVNDRGTTYTYSRYEPITIAEP